LKKIVDKFREQTNVAIQALLAGLLSHLPIRPKPILFQIPPMDGFLHDIRPPPNRASTGMRQ
jgi:hypothetical protein